jgi:NAD(P)-dependent dehydrogenase (short-subunit alcohol dehydrogenase family)
LCWLEGQQSNRRFNQRNKKSVMVDDKKPAFWIVTGAASGIGASVVRQVSQSGAKVLALDVDDQKGLALAAETGATYRHCDISDQAQWHQLVKFLLASKAELGSPTNIHLNAGIQAAPPEAPLTEYQLEAVSIDRYRRMMGVNVDGIVFGLQSLLPLLSSGAAIVVTASLAGVTPYAIDPLYAMSKHAVVGLVRSLGPALAARGIGIHALCPGAVDTAIIPEAQKTAEARFMPPEMLAQDVIELMQEPEVGKSWIRLNEARPRYITRALGDKQR